MRTTCKNNPASGRVGCGAAYSGKQVHCGICHQTFAAYSAMDKHSGADRHGGFWHQEPGEVGALWRDAAGLWHRGSPRDATVTCRLRTGSPPRGRG